MTDKGSSRPNKSRSSLRSDSQPARVYISGIRLRCDLLYPLENYLRGFTIRQIGPFRRLMKYLTTISSPVQ